MHVNLLGKLWIKDIFVYYDEPLMFSCENQFRQLFLANCVEEDEVKKTWIIVPISNSRLLYARRGSISVHKLFSEPEGEFLWRVEEYVDEKISYAFQILPNELCNEELPTEDAYFEPIKDDFLSEQDREIVLTSVNEKRTIIDLSLEPDNGHTHEIPPDVLGKTLCEFQDLVYCIAHRTGGVGSPTPRRVIEDNQLNVTGMYAASFGIRLKSRDLANIFGETLVQHTLNTLGALLRSASNNDEIKNVLSVLSPKVGLRYRKLLLTLTKNNLGVKTYIASPNKDFKEIFLSSSELHNSLEALESEINNSSRIIKYEGVLVGADVSNKSFAFIPFEEKKINGRIADDINIEKFIVPVDVKVKIKETIEINAMTKKEDISYLLLEVIDV
jgi:hypothetical protein